MTTSKDKGCVFGIRHYNNGDSGKYNSVRKLLVEVLLTNAIP